MEQLDNGNNSIVGMGMIHHMYMVVYWTCDAEFIFKQWRTYELPGFIFGCFLTGLFGIFCASMPFLKIIAKNTKVFWIDVLWFLIQSICAAIAMFLMMTMNGWVNIAIALGMGIGHFIVYPYITPIPDRKNKVNEQSLQYQHQKILQIHKH